MRKVLTWGGIFASSALAAYLLSIAYAIFSTSFSHHQREKSYFEASGKVLHMFDERRKFDIYVGQPKLSSNTYVNDLTIDYSRDEPSKKPRENATLLMLVRNRELEGALQSMRSLEDRFNRKYHYDWTFLNDVPFDQAFIEATTAMASGKTSYGLIPSSDWDRPSNINETEFESCLQLMEEKKVLYGGSRSYRNMCRFNSGFFFRQEILDKYDYYFRVEPDVEYFCDFPYDPFKVMRTQGKKYGFVMSLHEYEDTIPTLWDAVEEFITDYPELIDMETNAFSFITDDGVIGRVMPIIQSNSMYNLCHFWSNFEIGDLSFFRSDAYLKYFEVLDSKGGFYYERWGDAPVHTIAAALLLRKEEIIHFDELGYHHLPFMTCPTSRNLRLQQRCICDPDIEENIDITSYSCLTRWWKSGDGKHFMKHI
ncbi:putative mannosyltransferase KTR2 [Lachancea thermotolerans]|uniref:KLTH0F05566p n=1 Tax=Lachancea thermotolerans (strain ATCC 56472 / CBS 6340 / NRRL Y-8284) TaxID=559295 RepID=C5DKK9_LACTC|nr:KLTH0F05566p [Lachancea thermotolerans CBS 6340]CAR24010.1 KLTH0F05566p [Lachancea thermotolerans CBS 6340]